MDGGELMACDVDRSYSFLHSSFVPHARTVDALDSYTGTNVRRVRRNLHPLRYNEAAYSAITPADLASLPERNIRLHCGGSSTTASRRIDHPTRAEFPGATGELRPCCWSAHPSPVGDYPTSPLHRAISDQIQGEFELTLNFSYFDGESFDEDYLKWEQEVDDFFYYACVPLEKQVRCVVRKLKGRARVWWIHMVQARRLEGRGDVKTWHKMKRLLRGKFLTLYFEDLLDQQQHTCSQIFHSMNMRVRRDELFNEQPEGVRKINLEQSHEVDVQMDIDLLAVGQSVKTLADVDQAPVICTNDDLNQNDHEHEHPYISLNKKNNSTLKGDSSFKHDKARNPFVCSFNDTLHKINLREASAQWRKEGGSSPGFQKRLESPSTPGIIVLKFSVENFLRKCSPSKWENVEKWLMSGSYCESTAPGRKIRMNEATVIKVSISSVEGPGVGIFSKEDFCVLSSDTLLKEALTDIKLSVLLNFRYSDQIAEEFMFKDSYCETIEDNATETVAKIRRRDVGIEMTPLESSKNSRCHTPMKSFFFSTRPNTSTNITGPLMVSNSRIYNSELKDFHFAKIELSAHYNSLVTYGGSREEENFHYLKLCGETSEFSYVMMLCLYKKMDGFFNMVDRFGDVNVPSSFLSSQESNSDYALELLQMSLESLELVILTLVLFHDKLLVVLEDRALKPEIIEWVGKHVSEFEPFFLSDFEEGRLSLSFFHDGIEGELWIKLDGDASPIFLKILSLLSSSLLNFEMMPRTYGVSKYGELAFPPKPGW